MVEAIERNRKWWVLGTVCFALFMIILDGNVVNLAIPSIINSFDASISQIEWVSNAYLLTFAVFLITFGRLGDEFGRKKMFMIGLALFTLGSVLCGFAGSVEQLIAFRVIQGLGGAAMMPATLSLITVTFKKEERGVALGVWGAMAGLGVVFGPIIGGYLTQSGLGSGLNTLFGVTEYWRYVFFINLPVGLFAYLAAWYIIPESKDKEKRHPVDVVGILLSGASIFFLTFAFIEGTKYGWLEAEKTFSLLGVNIDLGRYSIIPLFFILSAIFIILFFYWERKEDKEPLINLELFKDRNYFVGNLVTMIFSFAMMGSFFLLPLFLQSILGYEPAETGRILLPLALPMIVVAPLAGKFADKFGARYLAFSGLITMAFGQYLIARFTIDTGINDLILPFVVMGIGMGLVQAPISSAVLKNVPEDKAGGASGVVTTIRQVGAVMGIAVLGAVLQSYLVGNIETRIADVEGLPSAAKEQIVAEAKAGNAVRSSEDSQKSLEKTLEEQIKKAVPAPNTEKLSPESQKTLMAQTESMIKQITEKFQQIGAAIGQAIKASFVDSINSTIKIAALITTFGAFISLFLENPGKHKRKR
jgi:EmrB/QacA subfamily drug resistance transporter